MYGICYSYTTNGYHRTQWLQLICAFKPDFAWEIGLDSDLPNLEGCIGIKTADDLPSDMQLVVFSPPTARHIKPTITLPELKHSDNMIYMFGPDSHCISEEELGNRTKYICVSIPTKSDDEKNELFSCQAGAIVLYDRLIKCQ